MAASGVVTPKYGLDVRDAEVRARKHAAVASLPDLRDQSRVLVTMANTARHKLVDRVVRFHAGGGYGCSCGVPHVRGLPCTHSIKGKDYVRGGALLVTPPFRMLSTWRLQHKKESCLDYGDVSLLPGGNHQPPPAKPAKKALQEGDEYRLDTLVLPSPGRPSP